MGRGRAKAKQIKVARKLKYYSPDTDLGALQKELGGEHGSDSGADPYDESDYSDYADKYADVDDEPEESEQR
ncbi:DUF3073 family protein [Brevibacterium sp. 5221]|uniref:DUF3073 family protein n=1 Tax=Brevibacterium rongguiense TaxID=2695267 RepID=A0A6N9H4H6_9MICO|nr:DUF3073 domain-containing protein [Brevibacterium rongguiense]MYM18835.1 DUF3073 family protein [Brevibacterium rongguiense]